MKIKLSAGSGLLVLIGVTLSVISFSLYAEDTCHDLKDDVERLACYDRAEAEGENRTAAENRKHEIKKSLKNPFSLTPYRNNYMLFMTHNSPPNAAPFQDFFEPGESIDDTEAKFQISVQFEP